MAIKQIVVVSRKLSKDTGWVVSSAHEIPSTVDDSESFADSVMQREKDELSKKFVEFKNAEWKTDILALE